MTVRLKKIILISILTIAVIVISTIIFIVFLLRPIPLPEIPDNQLSEANTRWESLMLVGKGTNKNEKDDRYQQSAQTAQYGESGIIITSQLPNGRDLKIQGGPMDIIQGENVEYVLYGKEVGQYHIPYRLAFNDGYHFLHADFYLVKRNIHTKQGVVVHKWNDMPNSFGHLLYDPLTKIITVDLCAIGITLIEVDEKLEEKTSGYDGFNIVCSSNN